MYARTITLKARDGSFDQVLRVIRQSVIPAAERQEGFNAFVVMSNREKSLIVGTTYWTDENAMLASEAGEYLQEQISRVITFLSAPPTIEHYEVNALS